MEKEVVYDAEFWAKREDLIRRFREAKERKRQRVAEMTAYLVEDYKAKYGKEPETVNVW